MYIPKKIKVGFQKRNETYTGKLAYIIYYDEKGKIRKQASWEGWRDKTIEAVEFDNVPAKHFTLNKGVKRDGYWGDGRSMIRVFDHRDFEFEISINNLVGILMHTDISKCEILHECVYAWNGTELVLLPTNSIEYQGSVEHTARMDTKFSTKELAVGHTYTTKQNAEVVYLGRHKVFPLRDIYYKEPDSKLIRELPTGVTIQSGRHMILNGQEQTSKFVAKHIFFDRTAKTFERKDPAAYIAHVTSSECVPDYADLMDKLHREPYFKQMTSVKVIPADGASPFIKTNKGYAYRHDTSVKASCRVLVQVSDQAVAQIDLSIDSDRPLNLHAYYAYGGAQALDFIDLGLAIDRKLGIAIDCSKLIGQFEETVGWTAFVQVHCTSSSSRYGSGDSSWNIKGLGAITKALRAALSEPTIASAAAEIVTWARVGRLDRVQPRDLLTNHLELLTDHGIQTLISQADRIESVVEIKDATYSIRNPWGFDSTNLPTDPMQPCKRLSVTNPDEYRSITTELARNLLTNLVRHAWTNNPTLLPLVKDVHVLFSDGTKSSLSLTKD